MTKKTLAERFEVLEQEYNSVMSTKYMGTSAFSHRSREYIDSAKGNNWIARAKSYLKTVMERNLITTKILMIHKGLLGLVIIRDWLDITNLFLMQPETI